jgi:hypothetical protein
MHRILVAKTPINSLRFEPAVGANFIWLLLLLAACR